MSDKIYINKKKNSRYKVYILIFKSSIAQQFIFRTYSFIHGALLNIFRVYATSQTNTYCAYLLIDNGVTWGSGHLMHVWRSRCCALFNYPSQNTDHLLTSENNQSMMTSYLNLYCQATLSLCQ